MNKTGQQLLRVVLGVVLALGVIMALNLVGQTEFHQALLQRDWSEAGLVALGLVILGAALAGVVRLHPLVTGTASLVLAVLYGVVFITHDFWQPLGLPVIHTFSAEVYVVTGLLAGTAIWRLFPTAAQRQERSQSPRVRVV